MNSKQQMGRVNVPRQPLDLNDEQLVANYAKAFKVWGTVSAVITGVSGLIGCFVFASYGGGGYGVIILIASLLSAFLIYLFFMFFYSILKVFSNISTTLKDTFILLAGETDGDQATVEVSNIVTASGGNNDYDSSLDEAKPLVTPEGAEEYEANGVKFSMVKVEDGSFDMGGTSEQGNVEDDELPVHSVTLSDYMIGQTLVTQELWFAVMGENPSKFKGAKLPVECVSWEDCQDFITRLNGLTGKQFRMLTEAEWEYAALGGTVSRGYQYAGSDTLDDVAWYSGNSGGKTHTVGTKLPNELGIYDMSGNVWEWCQDWYDKKYYKNAIPTNPQGPSKGSFRVFRGGGWNGDAGCCRVSIRDSYGPYIRFNYLGLRLAL